MTSLTSAWPPGTREAYRASARAPELVEVPELSFLMVDGVGDPNTASEYTDAVGTLYAVAYALRFDLRRDGIDEKVMPLEGLWSGGTEADVWSSRDDWRWTMLIAVPDAAEGAALDRALDRASSKRAPASLDRLRLERFAEGRAAQVLHVGPYGEAERPTVERLHEFIAAEGLRERGRHHEVYLADPRRTAPERLRTILRHPVVG